MFLAFSLVLAGCKCITVPAQYAIRPKAGLNITFQEGALGQPERTVTITSDDLGAPPKHLTGTHSRSDHTERGFQFVCWPMLCIVMAHSIIVPELAWHAWRKVACIE